MLAGAFVYFLVRAAFDGSNGALPESLETLDESYLLLLGGPFAASVTAGLLTRTKLEAETIQKVSTDQAALKDLLSKDDGSGDLVDAQFLTFNLVAMIWFVGAIIATPAVLPVIPPALVGLTSLSALTYTASKAATRNAPVIQSVTLHVEPREPAGDGIRPGALVDIRGINFIPPGAGETKAVITTRVQFGNVMSPPNPTRRPPATRRETSLRPTRATVGSSPGCPSPT